MWPLLVFWCLVAHASSQDTALGTTSVSASTSTQHSVISLFLPMGSPDQIEASIVSASPNETAFALGCAANATSSSACYWDTDITVTEGESTVIWTNTHAGEGAVSVTIPPMTMECALVGAHTTETPIHGASSAICTARSTIPGLGIAASTSVLASVDIKYVPVTVTAGVEKIMAASAYATTAVSKTSTSSAGAAAMTDMALIGFSGAAGLGVAMLGML